MPALLSAAVVDQVKQMLKLTLHRFQIQEVTRQVHRKRFNSKQASTRFLRFPQSISKEMLMLTPVDALAAPLGRIEIQVEIPVEITISTGPLKEI